MYIDKLNKINIYFYSKMENIINEYKNINGNPLSNCGVTVGLAENDY